MSQPADTSRPVERELIASDAVPNSLPATGVHPGAIIVAFRKAIRSFGEFIRGDVDIETGRISGRQALLQITAMPIVLAIGGTMMLGGEVWARSNRVTDLAAATTSVSAQGVTLSSVSLDLPDPGRLFPGGEAADAINNNCLACHSAGMVLNQPRLSRAQWQAEVDKMRNTYKAPVAPQDEAAIVNYPVDRSNNIAQLDAGHAAASSVQ